MAYLRDPCQKKPIAWKLWVVISPWKTWPTQPWSKIIYKICMVDGGIYTINTFSLELIRFFFIQGSVHVCVHQRFLKEVKPVENHHPNFSDEHHSHLAFETTKKKGVGEVVLRHPRHDRKAQGRCSVSGSVINRLLVGGWARHPSEKWWGESQLGWWFPIYGKIKFHGSSHHQPDWSGLHLLSYLISRV